MQTMRVDRILQTFTMLLVAAVGIFLITFVVQANRRVDCQVQVNQALIASVGASRDANTIEQNAMSDLVNGLLTRAADPRALLSTYQSQHQRAISLRVSNPLPDPNCQ
jgi:hypothetical protein